ncbi:dTDP-4-amino-4,6-dideoxyglucose formyltransferase [Aquimarina latercula]|uniref:dTDP-4-amino-4,6-dideoxyglucose formyltransferase n=1 Tax=Aquimarina latercula TaxID=987 RepID=UPI0004223A26|nr:dTDP-4-amino-4,6-dideoxyglucose formyltransferase [Aquimarina latercula]
MYNKALVISDNPHMAISFKEISDELDLPVSLSFSISPFSNPDDFQQLDEIMVFDLKKHEDVDTIMSTFDLVFSIHCKQFFPEHLVSGVKCINVHPGFNPHNRGWYPQVFSIIENNILGATIHEIDNELDNGNIIARKQVELFDYDTSLTAYNKVLEAEKELLLQNLPNIVNNNYDTIKPEIKGELKLKKDFNNLLEIDLNKKVTYREVINHLRALNHGEYLNAYYMGDNGKKVYLKLDLFTKEEDNE